MTTKKVVTMTRPPIVFEPLLMPHEAARMLHVDEKTLARYVKAGQVAAVRLPSGHHRYRLSEIQAILDGPPLETHDSRKDSRT